MLWRKERWSQQGVAGDGGVDVEVGGGVGDGQQRELVDGLIRNNGQSRGYVYFAHHHQEAVSGS